MIRTKPVKSTPPTLLAPSGSVMRVFWRVGARTRVDDCDEKCVSTQHVPLERHAAQIDGSHADAEVARQLFGRTAVPESSVPSLLQKRGESSLTRRLLNPPSNLTLLFLCCNNEFTNLSVIITVVRIGGQHEKRIEPG